MYSYLFAINFNVSNVVLKHCRHIDLWKLVLTEHNEQAGLSTGSISHYDQLFPDCCHSCKQETEYKQKTAKATALEHFIYNSDGHFLHSGIVQLLPPPPVRNYEQPATLTFSCVDTTPDLSENTTRGYLFSFL